MQLVEATLLLSIGTRKPKTVYGKIAEFHEGLRGHEENRDFVQARTLDYFLGAEGVLSHSIGEVLRKNCFPDVTEPGKINVIDTAAEQMGLKTSGLLFTVLKNEAYKLKRGKLVGNPAKINSEILGQFYPLFEKVSIFLFQYK